jgi:inositol phosphorylceramide synthase catalytic subunit
MTRFDNKNLLWWGVGSAAYFAWFVGAVGLRTEHVVLYFLVLVLWFANERTRSWVLAFGIWIAYWMMYDSLRIAPNYAVNPPVHIADLYHAEKAAFGIGSGTERLTLNEWMARHTHPALDLLAGVLYMSWVPLPFALGMWLYRRRPQLYLRFAFCFFFVSLLGFAMYYLFPAAPPWYVANFGFGFDPNVPRSPAGLVRFDELTGGQFFHKMYARNANVFAAVPSLHSAYPLVGWLYARQVGYRWLSWFFGVLSVGIWVTALYTGHHYLIDVLAGIGVALLGYFWFEKWLLPRTRLGRWLDQTAAAIA